jgi:hypothetical protein
VFYLPSLSRIFSTHLVIPGGLDFVAFPRITKIDTVVVDGDSHSVRPTVTFVFLSEADTCRCVGAGAGAWALLLLLLLLRSCACSAAITLSLVASWLVKVEFVLVRVYRSSLSYFSVIARLATSSAVSL